MDDMTEGQMADYMAAQMADDYGDWGMIVEIYECPKCEFVHKVEYV